MICYNCISERFGLHYIDFADPERKRVPKASVEIFKGIAKLGKLTSTDL